jgi:sodium/potassium-transporting ATPase subunit alpha
MCPPGGHVLTIAGESEEVAGTVDSKEPNFLESHNIALLGTHVCNGTATAVVVLTGARTVMGRINKLTNTSTEQKTNLQKEITRFVIIIICLTVTLVLIMLITWLAWLRVDHYDFLNTTGILVDLMSLVVAFIPEGMPIAVALTLSLIARRMKAAKVLPKSLSVVETLGCVNVVCIRQDRHPHREQDVGGVDRLRRQDFQWHRGGQVGFQGF